MQDGPNLTLPLVSTTSAPIDAPSPADKILPGDEQLDRLALNIRLQFSQALAKEKEGDMGGKKAILQALPPSEAAHYEHYKEIIERMRLEAITTVSRAHAEGIPTSVTPPTGAASNSTKTGAAPVLTSFELKRTNASTNPVANTTDTDAKVKNSKCCALV